jgi:protoheme IX farnesyltransferase
MVGWAAISGEVSLASIALFAIIFMWTPPHFWALSLYRSGDYERAGVPMLPVVSGEAETKRQILLYTIGLIPFTLAPTLLGVTGWLYFAGAAVLGALFLVCALRVRFETGTRSARLMFGYSILYLFLLFLLMLADRAPAPGV